MEITALHVHVKVTALNGTIYYEMKCSIFAIALGLTQSWNGLVSYSQDHSLAVTMKMDPTGTLMVTVDPQTSIYQDGVMVLQQLWTLWLPVACKVTLFTGLP